MGIKTSPLPANVLQAAALMLGSTPEALKEALKNHASKAKRQETAAPPDYLVPTRQAAKRLCVSTKTLRNWELAGRITPVILSHSHPRKCDSRLIGGKKAYRASDLDCLISGGLSIDGNPSAGQNEGRRP